MLGENILMAPVFSADITREDRRDVYLPGPATWTHLWLGTVYEVSEEGLLVKALWSPIGSPPVFYRDTDTYQISPVLSQFKHQLVVGTQEDTHSSKKDASQTRLDKSPAPSEDL